MTPAFIYPDWPAPANIRACVTTRQGGASLPPFAGFNLATHVGDAAAHVAANRRSLRRALALPDEPRWLEQVHGTQCLALGAAGELPCADAAYTRELGVVCAVMTADCLPVLFCDRRGGIVAAAHAGWRGLLGGILEASVAAMQVAPRHLLAWLGPAIGPRAFEVGQEVFDAFVADDPAARSAFLPLADGKFMADLYQLARQRLHRLGLAEVYGGNRCTFTEKELFFSFRRDGQTGRMASLIWMHEAGREDG